MNHLYSGLTDESRFALADFNCASFNQRLGKGNYYKIIWARERDLLIDIDGYQITLKKDHVLFCTPLNLLKIEPYTEGTVSYVFSKEFYCMRNHARDASSQDYLFQGSFISPLVELAENNRQKFEVLFTLFKEEFERKDRFQGEMLMVLLKRLLIMLNRLDKENRPDRELSNNKLSIIGEFNHLVETHFRDKHKVSDYAELLHKTPKTLSNLFKRYSEKTALTYINERILIEARRLLLFSDKTAVEIAYELGYNEPGHFSKFFKNNIGTSPVQFRKKIYASA